MRVRLHPGGPIDGYQWDEEFRITKQWQEVSKTQAKAMLLLTRKGRPMVEIEEAKGRKASVEILPEASEQGDQEGES